MIPCDNDKTFEVNILLHCLIVVIFLTIFFWVYISKVIKGSLNNEVDGAIHRNVPKLMNYLDTYDVNKIDWDGVDDYINTMDSTDNVKNSLRNFAKEMRLFGKIPWNKDVFNKVAKEYSGEDSDIISNNRKLIIINILLILAVFIVFIIFVIYYKKNGYEINWKHLLIENVILFALIGVVEYLFFTRVASKYIPTSASFISASLIDSVKNQLIDDQGQL